jgi:hypothetical protein
LIAKITFLILIFLPLLTRLKACVEHRVLLGPGHAIELAFVVVVKTEVFHWSSTLPSTLGGSRQQSLALAPSTQNH